VYESEHNLIDACVAGEPDAWVVLKQRYQRLIRATVVRTSAVDDTTLDDLEALVYQKLLEDRCRRLRNWRGRARFSTYLVQVTRNQVLDWVDTQKRTVKTQSMDERSDAPVATQDFEADEESAHQVQRLHAAIQALPERQAVIMRLRIEGKSLREIAQLLRRPVGTISVENSRAMERLRGSLGASHSVSTGVSP